MRPADWRDFVSTSAFERASELGQHAVHRTACQDLDFGGIGTSRCSQCDGETDRHHNPREIEQSSSVGKFHDFSQMYVRDARSDTRNLSMIMLTNAADGTLTTHCRSIWHMRGGYLEVYMPLAAEKENKQMTRGIHKSQVA